MGVTWPLTVCDLGPSSPVIPAGVHMTTTLERRQGLGPGQLASWDGSVLVLKAPRKETFPLFLCSHLKSPLIPISVLISLDRAGFLTLKMLSRVWGSKAHMLLPCVRSSVRRQGRSALPVVCVLLSSGALRWGYTGWGRGSPPVLKRTQSLGGLAASAESLCCSGSCILTWSVNKTVKSGQPSN